MSILLFAFIMLGAALLNSLAGFGIALFAMPLSSGSIGLKTAAPRMGLVGIVLRSMSVYLYGFNIDFREIRWLNRFIRPLAFEMMVFSLLVGLGSSLIITTY